MRSERTGCKLSGYWVMIVVLPSLFRQGCVISFKVSDQPANREGSSRSFLGNGNWLRTSFSLSPTPSGTMGDVGGTERSRLGGGLDQRNYAPGRFLSVPVDFLTRLNIEKRYAQCSWNSISLVRPKVKKIVGSGIATSNLKLRTDNVSWHEYTEIQVEKELLCFPGGW